MDQTNQPRLTAEFCNRNRLVFYPKTIEEAIFIQKQLAEFGIRWSNGTGVGALANECVGKGMLVEEGKLYYNPLPDARNISCSADQFNKDFISPERAFLIEQFSAISARLDEMAARLAATERRVSEMHEALFPKMENIKPGLKRIP